MKKIIREDYIEQLGINKTNELKIIVSPKFASIWEKYKKDGFWLPKNNNKK